MESKVEGQSVSPNDAKPMLAAVVSMSATQEDFWNDVCHKVVSDAVFASKNISDTIEYLKSKYNIQLVS